MRKTAAFLSAIVCFAGFAETLVFAPGNGTVTNVNEILNGTFDIQVNEGTSGGGIVNLMSHFNFYKGDASVKCGTLGVVKLSPDNIPSSLGLNPTRLTLGNGTFRYFGEDGGTAEMDLLVSSATDNGACIIDADNDFTFLGKVDCERGAFVKTGPGKFTLATLSRSDGGTNQFFSSLYGNYLNRTFNETANGDAPENGYLGFMVNEGTLAISNAWEVTTVLGASLTEQKGGSRIAIGVPDDADEEERYGHLNIYGGKVLAGGQIEVGMYEKAPSSADAECKGSSLNIYDGTLSRLNPSKDLTIIIGGVRTIGDDVSTPSLNIYGGTLNFQYVRLGDNRGSKAKLLVAGGTMTGYGLYGAHTVPLSANGKAPSSAEFHVCSNGVFSMTQIVPTRDGDCDFTIKVTDGGTLNRTRQIAVRAEEPNQMDFYFDGGIFNVNGKFELLPACYTMRLGPQQSKINFTSSAGTCTLSSPIVSDGEFDGGLEFSAANDTVLVVNGGGNFNGPVMLPEKLTLRIEGNDISTGPIVSPYDVNLQFSYSGSSFAKLNASEWAVHGKTILSFIGSYPSGTYDIISVPYSSAFSHEDVILDVSGTTDASFSSRVENGRTVISVTFVERGTATTAEWTNANGGEWNAAANWSGSTVPSGINAVASFPTASAAARTQVQLNTETTLSGLTLSASPGYEFTGGQFVFSNPGLEAKVSVTQGDDAINSAVAVSGLTEFNTVYGSTLSLGGVISGSSPIIVNSAYTGGGAVTLTGANTFTSDLRIGSGKLCVSEVANVGEASPIGKGPTITLNRGTFEFTGEEGETDKAFVIASDIYHSGAISVVEDSTLTLNGPFYNPAGAFTKKGKGELILNGPYTYEFGNKNAFYNINVTTSNYSDNYDALKSFYAGMITAGTMRWGRENQTVNFKGPLVVGMLSSFDEKSETHAELIIDGGETIIDDDFRMGVNHGNATTAECDVLTNRFVMNGGFVKSSGFQLTTRTTPFETGAQVTEFILNDGLFHVSGGAFNLGHTGYGADTKVKFEINGGHMKYDAGNDDIDANIYIGAGEYPPHVTVDINGGVFEVEGTFRFSWSHKDGIPHVVNVNEGGTLITPLISAAGTAKHAVNWNGGAWKPSPVKRSEIAGNVVNNISANGMNIDTTDAYRYDVHNLNGTYQTMDGVENDGGIRIVSDGSASDASLSRIRFQYGRYNFNGPITCAKGGVAESVLDVMEDRTVVVEAGGGFAAAKSAYDATEEVLVANLVLENDSSLFNCYQTAEKTGIIRVTQSLDVRGNVYVSMFSGHLVPATNPGTYPILRAPKGSIDVSKFSLSPRYSDAVGSFVLDTSSSDYDQLNLVLTSAGIARDHIGYVWNAGSGNWSDSANWADGLLPQGTMKDSITVPASTPDGSTIDLQGDRVFAGLKTSVPGDIYLDGGTLLPAAVQERPFIETTDGTLHIKDIRLGINNQFNMQTSAGATQIVEGVMSSPVTVNINSLAENAGTVRFENTATAYTINSSSGTLEGPAHAFDGNTLYVRNSTLRFSEGGVSTVKSVSDVNDGLNIDVEEDMFLTGAITCSGPFVKTGAGTLYLSYPGNLYLGQKNRSPSDRNTAVWQIQENGDLPTEGLGVFSLAAGKIVMGFDPNQLVTISGRMDIGQNIADFDDDGNIIDSEFEVLGGKLNVVGDINIGRNLGVYRQFKDCGEKKRNVTLTLRDGTIECSGLYIAHDNSHFFNGTATLNIHDGLFKSKGGYIYMGAHRTTDRYLQYGAAKSVVNIYGGMFTNTAAKIHTFHHMNCDFDINLYGGDYAWSAPYTMQGTEAAQKGRFNLHGGTFTAHCIIRKEDAGDIGFHWNGGTFRPTSNDTSFVVTKAWSYNIVSTNGAILDIGKDKVFTLNQEFTHDEELASEQDGGLEKRGEGTLLMDVANSFNGPCIVSGGVMRPSLTTAVPGGIVANGAGRFDMNGLALTVPYLKGDGGLVDNGILTVTDLVEPMSSVTVANLQFGANTVFKSRHSYDEASGVWKSNFFKVLSSASGEFTIDLGHDQAYEIPDSFDIKVAEFAPGVKEPNSRIVNVGRPNSKYVVLRERRVNADGNTELWVTLGNSGLQLILK